jgi:hypothetical protein
MMQEWLATLPLWIWGLAIVGGFIGTAVGGFALTRRWMAHYPEHPNDLAGFVYAVVGVTYAVLIGMSALAAYERYNSVEHTASLEANTVADLYRDLEGYPSPTQEQLQRQLQAYVHAVLDSELPDLRRGRPSPTTSQLVDQLVVQWVAFEPKTEGQKILHAEALRRFNRFLELRRERLQEGNAGLHPVIWFVLLSGAALTIGFTYLFWAESHQLHGMMVGFLAGVVGLIVFWMAAMDYPLRGPLSISTDSFEDVRTTIDRLAQP